MIELNKLEQSLDSSDRSESFHCERRARSVTERQCINMFCEIHASRTATSPCYMCRQGAALRIEYALEKEPTETRIDAMLLLAQGTHIQPSAYRELGISCG